MDNQVTSGAQPDRKEYAAIYFMMMGTGGVVFGLSLGLVFNGNYAMGIPLTVVMFAYMLIVWLLNDLNMQHLVETKAP